MQRLQGAALLWLLGLLLLVALGPFHGAHAVRFGAGLVKRANAARSSREEGTKGKGTGKGAELSPWAQRIKGELATRWDQGLGRAFNGSAAAASRQDRVKVKDGAEEYSGSSTLRFFGFWSRVIPIYSDYKLNQLVIGMKTRWIRDPAAREVERARLWDVVHDRNSVKVLDLCLSLRGMYLKAGQFIASRGDLAPMQWVVKLSTLHDRVPPISEAQIRKVLEKELGGKRIQEMLYDVDLSVPIGSASICQVHSARLKREGGKAGERVAIKIQYPGAEALFLEDLENIRRACVVLERDLRFDLRSMCRELSQQLSQEFDFRQEAEALRTVGGPLERALPFIAVPRPILATKKVLVMSFLDGVALSRLEEEEAKRRAGTGTKRRLATRILTLGLAGRPRADGAEPPSLGIIGEGLRRRIGRDIVSKKAEAWAWMLFEGATGAVHCDNHPGNILLMKGGRGKGLRLGILDWGQSKIVPSKLRSGLARLYVAMAKGEPETIKREFARLGIETEKKATAEHVKGMCFSIFDCVDVDAAWAGSPISNKEHPLNENRVVSFPQELMYILRAVQIMRGVSNAFGQEFCLAKAWAPYARRYLERVRDEERIRELEGKKEEDVRRGVVI